MFGLSISQWLPCPLAIWAFALDGNLVQSCYITLRNTVKSCKTTMRLTLKCCQQFTRLHHVLSNEVILETALSRAISHPNIIPLFKKGSRNKSENYRPVNLTSVICKLLERLIKDHMVDFLAKHKLLNSSQHGFLKARSCLTNMLCFLEEITKWIDVGSPVDIIYLDFQKAFDKVPHQRLLLKLKAHGIGDSITDWIEQWLTDRRQRVVVDGEVSN